MLDRDVVLFIFSSLWTWLLATDWGRSVVLLKPWRSRQKEKRNARIQKRIDLIIELSTSPGKAQAYFCAKGFALAMIFFVVFFFSVMTILAPELLANTFGFFILWAVLVFVANEPFDIAVKLRNPEKSIEKLEGMKK